MVYQIYQKINLQMEKPTYSNLNLRICIRIDQNNGILKDKCFWGNQKVITNASPSEINARIQEYLEQ